MKVIFAALTLSNPVNEAIMPVNCNAIVEPCVRHLFIPEHIAKHLALATLGSRDVILPNGTTMIVPYVGPIHVQFGERNCVIGAVIEGNGVLLGTIPMDDMNLLVRPMTQDVVENPRPLHFSPRVRRKLDTL